METKSPRLAVISLWAEDLPTTVHFYRDAVGLELLPHHGHRPAFALGNQTFLVIVQGQPDTAKYHGEGRFPEIAFAVDDLDAAMARLEAHGVTFPDAVHEGENERWVIFSDPAGNLVEFVQLR